ncbi:APC family permease [Nocardioides sp. Kera G14]|uniref:APC family permease n=1 Tax=Nocardioides sp. Kera G14 TaxID=2884264 RepID=UPI001D11026A|nr:APC family permease [Nocardioides sp. Kera G14]UDY24804.1 APC family permease [Nocardioides sp. Kera G14]
MTLESQAAPTGRDTLLTTELVPEQILPKVMTTFGLTSTYVFIICWLTGSSIMAGAGWQAIPFWVLGVVFFLLPAGLAVSELGNLWPGQGGVYIWAHRTMGEGAAFVGGFLSWIPVILNGASSPAIILQLALLAFHSTLGVTVSVILQLVILWAIVGMSLAKLAANQKVINGVFVFYGVLTVVLFVCGVLWAGKHGSATDFSWKDVTVPNFATGGFLFGTVLLYLVGVETPFNMGAEFLSVKRSATKMIFWGSISLMVIYLLTTISTFLIEEPGKFDSVTGVVGVLDKAGFPGLMEIAALGMLVIVFIAMTTYQIAYSRLIFVSGLEKHLPRIFTHLNPRTRNPVTALLVQGVISSLILVGLFSQASMEHVTLYLTGGLSVVWLLSGFFFFIPPLIARVKYADRYATEDFWRIPGGTPAVWATCLVGMVGTAVGIYYSIAVSWTADVSNGTWATWVIAITAGVFVGMGLVYFFGRRAASKLNEEDSLAHLAKFDLTEPGTA